MQLANRKIKVCFPSLNIFSEISNFTTLPLPSFKVKCLVLKVKIVKKYLQFMNVFHCLGFISLYEKTHKFASLLQNS